MTITSYRPPATYSWKGSRVCRWVTMDNAALGAAWCHRPTAIIVHQGSTALDFHHTFPCGFCTLVDSLGSCWFYLPWRSEIKNFSLCVIFVSIHSVLLPRMITDLSLDFRGWVLSKLDARITDAECGPLVNFVLELHGPNLISCSCIASRTIGLLSEGGAPD